MNDWFVIDATLNFAKSCSNSGSDVISSKRGDTGDEGDNSGTRNFVRDAVDRSRVGSSRSPLKNKKAEALEILV